MNILIVDDSSVTRTFLTDMLQDAGYAHILHAASVDEAFRLLCPGEDGLFCNLVNLILMDINMPGKDGIQGCRELKKVFPFQDIPVIIVSGLDQLDNLEPAFAAGAMDYLTKPPHRVELLARVRSALRLKEEMDRRQARERELLALTRRLEEVNHELQRLSTVDGLTGIANRHFCNEFLDREWRRAVREEIPFAVAMADVDCFKAFNDTYGHLAGDDCLRRVAVALGGAVRRPGDLLARYGGEEFIALLPGTTGDGALAVAEAMRVAVAKLGLEHTRSPVAGHVTVSIGVASATPGRHDGAQGLVAAADAALYAAKRAGRNRVEAVSAPL
ncbi:MAG TPA: diguanylate cyclase [Geobacteraceae bacterium]